MTSHGVASFTDTSNDERQRVVTDEHSNAHHLEMNGIARVHIQLQQALPIDAYSDIKAGGAFIMIDEVSNQTVAGGMFA